MEVRATLQAATIQQAAPPQQAVPVQRFAPGDRGPTGAPALEPPAAGPWSRRQWLRGASAALAAAVTAPGCVPAGGQGLAEEPEHLWGRRGLSDGRLLKPRAMAIDAQDQLYIVDMTGRIQVFDTEGQFLRGWRTPETDNGRPTGLTISPDGRLLVADTHYHRMLVYQLDGQRVEEATIGGEEGTGPGQFAFVTDAVRDAAGDYYIGEYGDSDRIQRFDSQGRFVSQWGGTGDQPGRFVRPQSLVIAPDGRLWIADACNHRIQIFDIRENPARLVQHWGELGRDPGQLYYPYDLALAADGTVWVCEYGNQRIQHFTADGRTLGIWGRPGHGPGQLYQPWAVELDSRGRLHVLDSNNHRIQRVLV